jgi:hypothetical protein
MFYQIDKCFTKIDKCFTKLIMFIVIQEDCIIMHVAVMVSPISL